MLKDDGSWGFCDPLASGSGSNTLPAADQGLESAPASPTQSQGIGHSLGDTLLHFPASSHAFTCLPLNGASPFFQLVYPSCRRRFPSIQTAHGSKRACPDIILYFCRNDNTARIAHCCFNGVRSSIKQPECIWIALQELKKQADSVASGNHRSTR